MRKYIMQCVDIYMILIEEIMTRKAKAIYPSKPQNT